MQTLKITLAAFPDNLSFDPAVPEQIGPVIRVGPKEITIGGAGIKDGKVVTPTADQILETAINSTPLAALSEADKANVKQAIVTTGLVTTVVSNPITGLVIIKVLSGTGQPADVPVPVTDAPPTGKILTIAAKCIAQQEGKLITAMFVDDPVELDNLRPGDTLNLTAEYCPEYPSNSITAVTIKYTGRSDYLNAAPPLYRHYIVGDAA